MSIPNQGESPQTLLPTSTSGKPQLLIDHITESATHRSQMTCGNSFNPHGHREIAMATPGNKRQSHRIISSRSNNSEAWTQRSEVGSRAKSSAMLWFLLVPAGSCLPTGFCYITQSILELSILLPRAPKCPDTMWDITLHFPRKSFLDGTDISPSGFLCKLPLLGAN